MKNSFFEKSTWKWILAWLAVCWVFFLGAFAAEFSLSGLKIELPNRLLQQAKWNGLIDAMWGFASSVNANLKDSTIPKWTVIIFDGDGDCPDWWKRWVWAWEYLIMPSKNGTKPSPDWEDSFTITAQNLPKHSHFIVSEGWWNVSVNEAKSLSEKNFWGINNWYPDYILNWSSVEPNYLKTSDVWEEHPTPITFKPKHQKVLFCIKK